MIIGDPSTFAIESGITQAYERLSLRGLGYFVIHIGGHRYGVHAPDATMLACSFDEVQERTNRRGRHTAPFANESDGGKVADSYRDAIFAPNHENQSFFNITQTAFSDLVYSNHIVWAPDGDEAFDDGSYVLHFDIGDRVRLIAFKGLENGYHHDPTTLTDVWLEADRFYLTLREWRDAFEVEWKSAPKTVESRK